MEKYQFIEKIKESLEIEDAKINENTNLTELEEYDSLAIIALVSMIDEHFGKALSEEDIKSIRTIKSLMEIIGLEHFE